MRTSRRLMEKTKVALATGTGPITETLQDFLLQTDWTGKAADLKGCNGGEN